MRPEVLDVGPGVPGDRALPGPAGALVARPVTPVAHVPFVRTCRRVLREGVVLRCPDQLEGV